MKREVIIEVLREVLKDARSERAKHQSSPSGEWCDGRAHAFRFALSLLDEDGPEARELEATFFSAEAGMNKENLNASSSRS